MFITSKHDARFAHPITLIDLIKTYIKIRALKKTDTAIS